MGTQLLITFLVCMVPLSALWFWRSRHYNDVNRRSQEEVEAARDARRADLIGRFGAENAERVLAHEVWMGATWAMLWESIGYPDGITEKTTPKREREIYKYIETGKGRFALKVTVDDGVVTGWDGDRDLARAEAARLWAMREYRAPRSSFWTVGRIFSAAAILTVVATIGRSCAGPPFYYPTSNPDGAPARAPAAAQPAPVVSTTAPKPIAPTPRPHGSGATPARPRASASAPSASASSAPTAAPSAAPTPAPMLDVQTE